VPDPPKWGYKAGTEDHIEAEGIVSSAKAEWMTD
jgi:hypothetical protein